MSTICYFVLLCIYPIAVATILETITENKFPVELHKNVFTEDGYTLTMYRIPPKNASKTKPPVLVIHGIMGNAENFVLMGQDSLAFRLAKSGYDVWLANSRDSSFSIQNSNSPRKIKQYWNFSLFEMGVYDMTALVDYVLRHTSYSKIYLIAYSQGTVISSIMLSERPTYNDKIEVFLTMSPLIHVNFQTGPLSLFSKFYHFFEFITSKLNIFHISLRDIFNQVFPRKVCSTPGYGQDCLVALKTVSGFSRLKPTLDMLNAMRISAMEGIAMKPMIHFAQISNLKRFAKYDYGPENWQKYNTEVSPAFNVSKITVPVALFYCVQDNFATIEDFKQYERELPNVVESYVINDKNFSHMHYILVNSETKKMYNRMIKIMDEHWLKSNGRKYGS